MDGNTIETNDPCGVLTAAEREALRVALETGGFEVSGETTVADRADELARSAVEGSEGTRRGTGPVSQGGDVPGPPDLVSDGGADPDALDRMFDALRHPYRRRILLLVSEHNPREEDEFSVGDLATEDDDLELLTTELYHAHLPKLAESGYIDWDEETQTIRRGPNFEEVAPLLRLMTEHRDDLPDGWP